MATEHQTTLWNNIKSRACYLKKSLKLIMEEADGVVVGEGVELGVAITEEIERVYKRIDEIEKRIGEVEKQSKD